jgi:hypothetical protein
LNFPRIQKPHPHSEAQAQAQARALFHKRHYQLYKRKTKRSKFKMIVIALHVEVHVVSPYNLGKFEAPQKSYGKNRILSRLVLRRRQSK